MQCLLRWDIIKNITAQEAWAILTVEAFYRDVLKIQNMELIRYLCTITTERHLAKKEKLIQAGEVEKQVVFLLRGVLRGYIVDADGRDITDCFGYECGTAAMGSVELDKPTSLSIEALTESDVLCIPLTDVLHLLEQYPELVQIYNRFLQHALNVHCEVKTIITQYSAMERYNWFLKAYPGLIDRISNKYVASFLGMTPVTLSRMRAALRAEKEKD